jgi:hypothetical protein
VRQLERRGLRAELRDVEYTADCGNQAYGQVQDFFCQHPCQAGFRALFEVRDRRGYGAAVAVAWVDFDDERQAAAYASARDGATVVNVQAQPLGRQSAAARLAREAIADAL